MISVVVPAFNAEATIGGCLRSIAAAGDVEHEAIVVDDGSGDGTAAVAAALPCRLLRLEHAGAGAARNAGAAAARGEVLFFTDADCLLAPDALRRVREGLDRLGPRAVLGGTYAVEPADPGFYPRFQAVFVNHAETSAGAEPDYVATHAFAIRREEFLASGGFDERFLPILEDVELSHRLRRAGFRLFMDPDLQVRHRFGFGLAGSLANAARKSRHWVRYSLGNRDLLAGSGTASRGLKAAGAIWLCGLAAAAAAAGLGRPGPLAALPVLAAGSLLANRGLLAAFSRAHGRGFALAAAAYLAGLYPGAALAGALAGGLDRLRGGPAQGGGA